MATYRDADILRHVAREEPLSITLKAFPGLTRERLARLIERVAETIAPGNSRASALTDAALAPSKVRVYSDGAARGNPGPSGAGAMVSATRSISRASRSRVSPGNAFKVIESGSSRATCRRISASL